MGKGRRSWGRSTLLGGVSVLVAIATGVLAAAVLGAVVPGPITGPVRRPVLETVTPAQLAAMSLRLDPALQPVAFPDWLTSQGVEPPSTILLRDQADARVMQESGDVRRLAETVLAYATLTGQAFPPRRTVVERLAWVVVGVRRSAGWLGAGGPALWLVDAHSGRMLTELAVPAAPPAAAGQAQAQSAALGP